VAGCGGVEEEGRERREPDGNYDMISIISWQPFLPTSYRMLLHTCRYHNHNRWEK